MQPHKIPSARALSEVVVGSRATILWSDSIYLHKLVALSLVCDSILLASLGLAAVSFLTPLRAGSVIRSQWLEGNGSPSTATALYSSTSMRDNSNIYIESCHMAEEFEPDLLDARRCIRLNFPYLVHTNCPVRRIVAVGSVPPELQALWNKMEWESVKVEKCYISASGLQQAANAR